VQEVTITASATVAEEDAAPVMTATEAVFVEQPTPAPLPTASDGRYPKPQEEGFVVSVVANSAERPFIHATSITWGPDGAMYVSRQEGPIVRVATDGERTIFAEDFDVPVGLAFQPKTEMLYVSHRGGITTLRDINNDGVAEEREAFVTGMACCYADLHQTNGLQFGPDGWLYFSQGANSDHGEILEEPWHAGILRVHPAEGQESLEYVATGVRNGYDLVVRPNGDIFATENGADYGPPEELNHIIAGEDYGWPHCISEAPWKVAPHPEWNDATLCQGSRAAIATFIPHSSPNGITSYEAEQFPHDYQGNLFVALWSHFEPAFRIVRVQLKPKEKSFTTTVTPFVTDLELPLDVAIGPEGALYIVDWGPGRIYKVEYRPEG
jgi:putative membrane-bound dehydrogenase-like protein